MVHLNTYRSTENNTCEQAMEGRRRTSNRAFVRNIGVTANGQQFPRILLMTGQRNRHRKKRHSVQIVT